MGLSLSINYDTVLNIYYLVFFFLALYRLHNSEPKKLPSKLYITVKKGISFKSFIGPRLLIVFNTILKINTIKKSKNKLYINIHSLLIIYG